MPQLSQMLAPSGILALQLTQDLLTGYLTFSRSLPSGAGATGSVPSHVPIMGWRAIWDLLRWRLFILLVLR